MLIASKEITEQHIEVARKYKTYVETGDLRRARLAFDSGEMILDRVYPAPRSPAVQIDLAGLRTPAELRTGMETVLAQVAAGEIPPDAGDHLLGGLRKALDAHRIQTFDMGATVEVQQSSARDQLAGRLARAIEERRHNTNGQAAASPDPDASTDGSGERASAAAAGEDEEIDLTEEQLAEMAERAALEVLRKRGV